MIMIKLNSSIIYFKPNVKIPHPRTFGEDLTRPHRRDFPSLRAGYVHDHTYPTAAAAVAASARFDNVVSPPLIAYISVAAWRSHWCVPRSAVPCCPDCGTSKRGRVTPNPTTRQSPHRRTAGFDDEPRPRSVLSTFDLRLRITFYIAHQPETALHANRNSHASSSSYSFIHVVNTSLVSSPPCETNALFVFSFCS